MISRHYPLFALLAATIFATVGCGFRNTTADPTAIAAQFETARNDELQLLSELVDDPERAKALAKLIDERDQTVIAQADKVQAYIDRTRALNADYDATRADFEQLIIDYRAARQTYQQDLVSIIGRMKAETTAKQWKRLAKFQLKALNPRDITQSTGGV